MKKKKIIQFLLLSIKDYVLFFSQVQGLTNTKDKQRTF